MNLMYHYQSRHVPNLEMHTIQNLHALGIYSLNSAMEGASKCTSGKRESKRAPSLHCSPHSIFRRHQWQQVKEVEQI